MENYICKIANKDELIKRWEYLVNIHSGNELWVKFKERTINLFDEGSIIPYIGILNGEIICEATAYINESAFVGDISEPDGLLSDDMAYLAAFRTNKEHEGQGYFSKLYKFIEEDIKQRGYKALSLGVGPDEKRNIEIYHHLGFTDYIKTITNKEDSGNGDIVFYKKEI